MSRPSHGSPRNSSGTASSRPSPHGGDFDPFSISFDRADGQPSPSLFGANSSPYLGSASPPMHSAPGFANSYIVPRSPPGYSSPSLRQNAGFSPPPMHPNNSGTAASRAPYQRDASQPSHPPSAAPGPTDRASSQVQSHGISRVPVSVKSPSDHATQNEGYREHHVYAAEGVATPSSSLMKSQPVQEVQDVELQDIDLEKRQDSNYRVPRVKLKGYLGNFVSWGSSYRIIPPALGAPHSYRKAGISNDKTQKYHHLDSLQRIYEGPRDDRYIDPVDGKIKLLVVQCTDRIFRGPNSKNSTYQRTFIRNVAPITLRVANWPQDHLNHGKNSSWAKFKVWVKWPMACFVLVHLIGIPGVASTGMIVNDGHYDAFPYRYWGYCKADRSSSSTVSYKIPANITTNRTLEPAFLCFVEGERYGRRRLVSAWKDDPANARHRRKCPAYLFVSYTSSQFSTPEDMLALHEIATQATKDAGLSAYWLGHSCMQTDQIEEDVYRISDIVRAAHSLVIAVAPAMDEHPETNTQTLLQHFGQRLWTLPEVLLIPNKHPISVYRRGEDTPFLVPKKMFAKYAWHDSAITRQLIDHYEGSLTLSRLELVVIALQALFARETIGDTMVGTKTQYLQGDHAYALMGLLRLRPKIDPTDSPFQALARLSLANDSDKLLERLMCILPASDSQPWHDTTDTFGAAVWDIYPSSQVAGICDDDSVLIDGAFGATIHWDKFRKVANSRRIRSLKRMATQWVLHGSPHMLVIGLLLYRAAEDSIRFMNGVEKINGFSGQKAVQIVEHWATLVYAVGFILIGVAWIIFMFSPWLTRTLYRGKFRGTQAWLFGFEGYLDLETIESQIFGSRMRRLRWSPYGSPLSHSIPNAYGECVGLDPTLNPVTAQKIEDSINNTDTEPAHNAPRIFTLVDTNTMTVTLFEARRPPVAVLLLGAEGGWQRAVGVSYEWERGVCRRETVLRFETTVVEKMARVGRVRVGV